jgi:SAM-dependent methyltransferase
VNPEALEFPKKCASICGELVHPPKTSAIPTRVLDIGCAVGGASFHLSQHFDEVVGIDFSQQFIDAANEMKSKGSMPFDVFTEGSERIDLTAKMPAEAGVDAAKCHFVQGDACDLKPGLSAVAKAKSATAIEQFDVILGSNLLCRLPSPRKFLSSLHAMDLNGGDSSGSGLLKPFGYLVLVSPYSWLEEYTGKDEWLFTPPSGDAGVRLPSTRSNNSFSTLSSYIGSQCNTRVAGLSGTQHYGLQLVKRDDVPFMIREHARKFQFGISDLTVWQNRPIA